MMGQAQKRKQQRKLQLPTRLPSGNWWRKCIFGALLLLVAADGGFNARRYREYLALQQAEQATQLFKEEIVILAGSQPQLIAKYPLSVRKKLEGVYFSNVNKQVDFGMAGLAHPESDDVLMAADFDGPKPRIMVYAPKFLELRAVQSEELFRSTLAIAVLHEYIHLEIWPRKPEPGEDKVVEEIRTYHKMLVEVVRPIRESGLDYPSDYAKLDDVLRACNDSAECPQFRQAVRNYVTAQ